VCRVELRLGSRVADAVAMKAKRDSFLDVVGKCSGGDGRLAENIDEALYGEEAFPSAGGLAPAIQGAVSVEPAKISGQHQRKAVRKKRKRRRLKSS
jgi:hypothetical protein